MWYDADGNSYTFEQMTKKVILLLKKHGNDRETRLVVGADSHVAKLTTRFITSVCVYWTGLGGFYFYQNNYETMNALTTPKKSKDKTKINSWNKQRIFKEVTMAVETAMKIEETIGLKPEVHIDASEEVKKEYTSEFSSQLKGYAINSGYETFLKPFSFGASGISNKYSK